MPPINKTRRGPVPIKVASIGRFWTDAPIRCQPVPATLNRSTIDSGGGSARGDVRRCTGCGVAIESGCGRERQKSGRQAHPAIQVPNTIHKSNDIRLRDDRDGAMVAVCEEPSRLGIDAFAALLSPDTESFPQQNHHHWKTQTRSASHSRSPSLDAKSPAERRFPEGDSAGSSGTSQGCEVSCVDAHDSNV